LTAKGAKEGRKGRKGKAVRVAGKARFLLPPLCAASE